VIPPSARPPSPPGTGNENAKNTPDTKQQVGAEPKPTPEARLVVADGQLRTHSFEVFTTVEVPRDQRPALTLISSHAATKHDSKEDNPLDLLSVASNQTRIITVGGKEQAAQGTLLLFSLGGYPTEDWKPMTRVRPALSWGTPKAGVCSPASSDEACNVLVSDEEINVGNPVPTYLYSTFVLAAILVVIALTGGWKVLKVQSGAEQRFSLSRCQAAAWTVVVGWVVLTFGIMMRAMPQLPWQVTALMTLSVTTATISNRQDSRNPMATVDDLDGTLSFSRMQMMVWTVISLLLFISKSILQGVIWEVPVELVTLMGVSQAGYLAPKFRPTPGTGATAGASASRAANEGTAEPAIQQSSPAMQPSG
jgi:hypothetical protein